MNKLIRLIIEIARSVRYELLSTFGTLLTIYLAMTLPGLFWVALNNLNVIERNLRDDISINIYLEQDLSDDEIESMRAELFNLGGIRSAQYLSKDDALFKMRESFGQEIVLDLDENPLPASFVLTVEDVVFDTGADSLISIIAEIPEVEEVIFAGDFIKRLRNITSTIKLLGLAVALLVAFSAIFITANTVRIAITDRKKTVEIMQLVGASRSYILTPFVSLGGLLGFVGGGFAVITVWLSSAYVSSNILKIKFLAVNDIIAYVLASLLLGMTGALIATKKYLRI
jgi:cell division transport system permease protein